MRRGHVIALVVDEREHIVLGTIPPHKHQNPNLPPVVPPEMTIPPVLEIHVPPGPPTIHVPSRPSRQLVCPENLSRPVPLVRPVRPDR